MNNHLFYGLLILLFNYNCTKATSQDIASNANTQDSIYVMPTHFNDDLVKNDALYTTIIRVDKQNNDEYVLSVQMNLKKNAYFVSPNAKGDFSGKFTIVLNETTKIKTYRNIIETPLSTEELHSQQGLGNFVRQNTYYKQTLKVQSSENFEVNAYLQFTIEPRCTLEKIPFILSYQNGKLSVRMDGC